MDTQSQDYQTYNDSVARSPVVISTQHRSPAGITSQGSPTPDLIEGRIQSPPSPRHVSPDIVERGACRAGAKRAYRPDVGAFIPIEVLIRGRFGGLSQASDKTGIERTTLRRILRGQRAPNDHHKHNICRVLDISPEWVTWAEVQP